MKLADQGHVRDADRGPLGFAPVVSAGVPPESLTGVSGALPRLELPKERRPSWAVLAALATLAGVGAIALGTFAIVVDDTPSGGVSDGNTLERTVAVLASPGSVRIPLAGSVGRMALIVGDGGDAVLALNGLGRATGGRSYQAWVTLAGSATPLPAGVFDGSERFVVLTRAVPPGARVGVTAEDDGGATSPSRAPRLNALRP